MEHQRFVRKSEAGKGTVFSLRGTGLRLGILFHLTRITLLCLTLPALAEAQGVCDRTPQVRDVLVAATRASTCGEVTDTHLSGVRRLRILTAGIAELQEDDFSGLDSLEELFLDDNQLSTLPEEIFSELTSLKILSLKQNPLTSLPAGLFNGLDNLQDLAMIPNHLSSLPAGIFSGLSSLQQLRVGGELTSLPAGIFSGLSSLQQLWLFGTMPSLPAGIFSGLGSLHSLGIDQKLTSLPSGVFNGLSSLVFLNLTGNRLTSLPAEIFRGLRALEFLNLNDNSLTLLPAGLFGGLGSLQHLEVNDNSLNSLPSGIFSGLNSLDGLYLEDNELESLPSGVFGDLTKLRFLSLEDNELESLPAGIFDGLASLIGLNLGFNAIPLLPAGIFDDVLDTLGGSYTVDGYTAQGRLTLEYRLLQAELALTSTAQRLPQGSDVRVEATLSRALPVGLRVPYTLGGTAETGDYADLSPAPADGLVFAAGETYKEITLTLAGVVDNAGKNLVMTLGNYSEIKLRRSDGTGPDAPYLSSRLFAEYPSSGEGRTHTVTIAPPSSPPAEGICERTPEVRDALVKAIAVVSDCAEVNREDLAGVTSLGISGAGITELHADDFSGLNSLRELNLAANQLTRMPEGVFSGLGTLERLTLNFNPLESLPEDLFSGLGSLKELNLIQISNPHGTAIAPLPEGVFQGLSSLQSLYLSSNQLTALPEQIFAGLSSLKNLVLNFNSLVSLPEEVFKGLGNLRTLEMTANSMRLVPEALFSGLGALEELHLNQNHLTGLPEGVFEGLGSLQFLSLRGNWLSSLPEGIFNGLGALENLYLAGNSLTGLPAGIFNGLNSLSLLELFSNHTLTRLPIGIFDDVLDTLGSSPSADERLPLQLDSELKATPAFTSTAQRASAGSPVRLEITLSQSLPVAVRIPYTLDGTATEDHYADLAPDPSDGLLFPAGETSRAISFTLTAGEEIESVGRTLVMNLSNPSGIKLRRSDGSGPDAPHLSAEPVIAYRDEGASHTLTITPEGTGPAEGICDRTPLVRDALVEAVAEVSTCGQVIAADLAKVTSLSLEWSGIVSLKANDFSGLSSLNSLRLHGNSLTALPEGLFEELVNLQILTLDHNSLTGLPPGVFSGLARLQELSLSENPLGSLSEDTFKGLSQLQRLILDGISLGYLPEGLFNGLSRLEDVFLGNNSLTRLSEKAFSALGSLRRLFLHNNKIESLPEAVFNGLSSLQVLDLYANSLSVLPEGIFRGLTSLERLRLGQNPLNALPRNLFDELDSLVELTLGNNNLTSLPTGIFDEILDTIGSFQGILGLDPDLKALLEFALSAQRAAAGGTVSVEVTLSRTLPVTVRIPYTLGGTATADDYSDMSPTPEDGLLFLAGETSKVITFNLADGEGSVGKTLELTLAELSEVRLRRSDGSGPDVSYLSPTFLIVPNQGAAHTVTIAPPGFVSEGGVCERTPQVRDALVEAVVQTSRCDQVILSDLAAIASLDFSRAGINALKAGDFAGMASLKFLSLEFNTLNSLPDAVFAGLASLEQLKLNENALNSLPEGVFQGLKSLRELNLEHNELIALPMRVFRGLDSLEQLNLSANDLTDLSGGAFRGLVSLQSLALGGNNLTALPEDLFSGLDALEGLALSYNPLTSLPEKIFHGLSSLEHLTLSNTSLSELTGGVFHGLVSLQSLELRDTLLTSLPEGILRGLDSLQSLNLGGKSLVQVPVGLLDGLSSLETLTFSSDDPLPAGFFDDVLDTLRELYLASHHTARVSFASWPGQTAAQGATVKVWMTLSRPVPVAVRVFYTVGGSATVDDYTGLSPSSEEGLLFLAGEMQKSIAFTLASNAASQGKTIVFGLGQRQLLRSDGTGEPAPHLSSYRLVDSAFGFGANHTVTIAGSVSEPEDPADFTAEDLTGMRLALEDASPQGPREAIRVIFREASRFEAIATAGQRSAATGAVRHGVEAESADSRFGSYDYQFTGPQTGSLTLDYDDGESCTIELLFDFVGIGTFHSDCSGSSSGSGSFQLRASSLFVPVILTSAGRNDSLFTSELALTNRGSREARLDYTYTAHAGGGSGTASEVLAPGQQRVEPDALDYLRDLGIPIPERGNRIGTLRVEIPITADVTVLVRTTTAVVDGRAGLAYLGVAEEEGFTEAVYLCGLRQNSQDRSNVAIQHMGRLEEGSIMVRATVFSGDPETSGGHVLKDRMLAPGGFYQYNSILDMAGFTNGYVKVERVEGEAPFYAYGVINDQANSDGSFVFPVTASSLEGTVGQTLPVIVETSEFRSELTVTNFSQETRTLDFRFVADAIQASDHTAGFTLMPMRLEGGEQRILPDLVETLRRQGVEGLGPTRGFYAGPVFVTAEEGDMSGIVIGARTGSQGEVGQYGVFYNAVPFGEAFSQEAWVDGLQQDGENRSNLALVNTGEVDDSESVFSLEIYDGETGSLVTTVTTKPIPARRWHQINGILGNYAAETRQGYIRIEKVSGENPFLAYGVVNDGGAPGERSGDGAYVPARE